MAILLTVDGVQQSGKTVPAIGSVTGPDRAKNPCAGALRSKKIIYIFILASFLFMLMLGGGAFEFQILAGHDPSIAAIYFDQKLIFLFWGYLLIKFLLVIGKLIVRRINYLR